MPEESIEALRKQLIAKDNALHLAEEKLSSYEKSGPVGFYYELNRLLNTTVEYMRKTNIKELIDGEKGDKSFERLMALVKEGKSNIDALEELRLSLRLSGKEDSDTEKHRNRITPERISDVQTY
jgi:hypothetical protein